VTDSAGVTILGLPNVPSDVDFEVAGEGTCLIWHLSYNDTLVGAVPRALVADIQGCFSLSNAITVIRMPAGDQCTNPMDTTTTNPMDTTTTNPMDTTTTNPVDTTDTSNPVDDDETALTCNAPTDPEVEIKNKRKVIVTWTPIENAVQYVLQIRFKGQTRWAATAKLRKPKVRIFAPAGKDYEYHIKTICENGESEYGELHELSTPPRGIVQPSESRSEDTFEADIVLTLPDPELEIAPNPVGSTLQIVYPVYEENTYFSIYSVNGMRVMQQRLTVGTFNKNIDVQQLNSGLYILKIYENGGVIATRKIVKQ